MICVGKEVRDKWLSYSLGFDPRNPNIFTLTVVYGLNP